MREVNVSGAVFVTLFVAALQGDELFLLEVFELI